MTGLVFITPSGFATSPYQGRKDSPLSFRMTIKRCLKVHCNSEIHIFYEIVNFYNYSQNFLFCKFFHTFYETVNFLLCVVSAARRNLWVWCVVDFSHSLEMTSGKGKYPSGSQAHHPPYQRGIFLDSSLMLRMTGIMSKNPQSLRASPFQ